MKGSFFLYIEFRLADFRGMSEVTSVVISSADWLLCWRGQLVWTIAEFHDQGVFGCSLSCSNKRALSQFRLLRVLFEFWTLKKIDGHYNVVFYLTEYRIISTKSIWIKYLKDVLRDNSNYLRSFLSGFYMMPLRRFIAISIWKIWTADDQASHNRYR